MVDRASVAGIIDHTLLKPEATTQQVAALVREAKELGTYSVCVSPSMLPLPESIDVADLKLAVVCGFQAVQLQAVLKQLKQLKRLPAGQMKWIWW